METKGPGQKAKQAKLPLWRRILLLPVLLILLAGCIMLLLPQCTGYRQNQKLNQEIESFEQLLTQPNTTGTLPADTPPYATTVPEETTQPYLELYSAMQAINEQLASGGQTVLFLENGFAKKQIDLEDYGIDTEVAGVISIPAIGVTMPLYLGATDKHMADGFAQLSYTSMPIGGENTNCVIAGHRGWRGAKYLLEADKLKLGDTVILQNYWETLTYSVVEIKVVHRHEVEQIGIRDGKDMLTLLTCTPIGVGTDRILIYCERDITQ